MKKFIYVIFGIVIINGCTGGSESTDPIQKGWMAFEDGDFIKARDIFSDVYFDNPNEPEAAHGLAWALLRMDSVNRSVSMFELSDGALPHEDVIGGYTFALNAKKMYNESNLQADILIGSASSWSFTHGSQINITDIYIVKASNHFALGNYTAALTSIKTVNESFNTDVSSASGRSALAAEIERLRGLNKK